MFLIISYQYNVYFGVKAVITGHLVDVSKASHTDFFIAHERKDSMVE